MRNSTKPPNSICTTRQIFYETHTNLTQENTPFYNASPKARNPFTANTELRRRKHPRRN